MRTLSAKIGINEDTFEPVMILMLDGEDSGVALQVEAISDIRVLHGPEAESYFITAALEQLTKMQSLTDEEQEHYQTNFKALIQI